MFLQMFLRAPTTLNQGLDLVNQCNFDVRPVFVFLFEQRVVLKLSGLLFPRIRPMSLINAEQDHYTIKPLKIGVEVFNICLQADPPPQVIERIKQDVHKHRIMVFRDQGLISGRRQVEISKWFGDLDSTFYRHPRSPDPDVFRVSNDEREGCRNVGRTGWHVDGSFQPAPFAYSIYHIIEVPKKGDTGNIENSDFTNNYSRGAQPFGPRAAVYYFQ